MVLPPVYRGVSYRLPWAGVRKGGGGGRCRAGRWHRCSPVWAPRGRAPSPPAPVSRTACPGTIPLLAPPQRAPQLTPTDHVRHRHPAEGHQDHKAAQGGEPQAGFGARHGAAREVGGAGGATLPPASAALASRWGAALHAHKRMHQRSKCSAHCNSRASPPAQEGHAPAPGVGGPHPCRGFLQLAVWEEARPTVADCARQHVKPRIGVLQWNWCRHCATPALGQRM